MYTPTSILPARIVRSLKGSKRASKHSSRNGKPTVTNEPPSSVFEGEGTSCFDDFEEITYDEVPPDLDHETSTLDTRSLSPLTPRPEISSPFALSHHKPDHPRLHHPRSKSLSHTLPEFPLSKSCSRSSLPLLPHSRQSQSRSRLHLPIASTDSLLSEFPKPPTHVPASSSRHVTLIDPPSASDCRAPRVQEKVPQLLQDPNTQLPSPPSTRPSSPSTIAPSDSRSTLTFYRRFRSFRSSLRLPRRSKTNRDSKRVDRDSVPASAPPQVTEFGSLPGVVSEPIDCSPFLVKDTPVSPTSSSTAQVPVITVSKPQEEESDTAVLPQPGCLQPPRITYERVDPLTLTRSPSGYPTPELDSLTATPLPSHSPSWLSRNVQDYQYHPSVRPQPPSPPPLIIPPPVPVGYLPPPDSALISEEEFQRTRILHTPSRPSTPSRHSTSHSPRYSSDRDSSLWKSRSPTVVGQSSPSFLQRSNSLSLENSPVPREGLLFVNTLPRTLSAPDLLAVPSNDNPSLLTPIDLFHYTYPSQPSTSTAPPPPPVPVRQPEPVVSPDPPQEPKYEFFVPPPRNQDPSHDQFLQRLPHHIVHTVINVLLREASLFSQEYTRMSAFNIFGKPMETVDIGQEIDYAGYEWFKDPPPPQMPIPTTAEPFVPQPGVIEQNEIFDFALKSAPSVLYSKYKQFGQLGVLAWCAEFSEMIDALKHLGFEGNMFVATRTQALKTCSDILQLNLDVNMQIIVMYLSSQVQRLRRFLDSERQWDDYPVITFPLPPQEAQRQ